jgi:hypothetical protein
MTDRFLAFSAEVTAFRVFELQGTGQVEAYRNTVVDVVGHELLDELLDTYDRVRAGAPETHTEALRREIFGDEKLGPIARNIVKLWYVGTWYELPRAWNEAFGARPSNVTFVVSGAYPEGLLWAAIGANPPGAKAPGYGSWAAPPQIPPVPVQLSSD